MCAECEECQKLRPSIQKETLEADERPRRPFDCVSADLFQIGPKYFQVYVDRLSGYPLVKCWMKQPSSAQVIKELREYFSLFGKPLKFRSDGGGQYDSGEMKAFLDEFSVDHGQSAPHHPQSNGHAERNVKIVKDLLKKTGNDINSKKFLDGIAQIRNSPREDGLSPSQVVFGRAMRTIIPTLTEALGTNDCVEKARYTKSQLDAKQKLRYDNGAKELKKLDIGTKVWIQDAESGEWDQKGIIEKHVRKRAYMVRLESGMTMHRNRRWLRERHVGTRAPSATEHEDVDEADDENCNPRRSERIQRMKIRCR